MDHETVREEFVKAEIEVFKQAIPYLTEYISKKIENLRKTYFHEKIIKPEK